VAGAEPYRIEAELQRFVADGVAQLGGPSLLGARLGRGAGESSSPVGGDALIGQPQAFGWRAGLPEHVDRHAAARVPVAAMAASGD